MAMGRGFRVFHKMPPDPETAYSVIMESKQQDDTIMFESGAVVVLSSGEAETLKKQYVKLLDAYGCLGALTLSVASQSAPGVSTIHYLVMVTGCLSVGKIGESEVFRVTAVQLLSLRNDPLDEERVSDVRKLLNSGTFYFSWCAGGNPWDLSLCAQRKLQDHDSDNRFFWNRMLHVHFQRYGIDCGSWLLKVMCGGVEIRTIYAGQHQAKACLISRLSCERAGTRFNVRGTNDDGHVANFVETEQVIFLDDQVVSFIQIRGSVPLFWEQPGINVGSHKVHMSRGYETAAPAMDRHLRMVKQQYGNQVIVNLLGCKEGEIMLSQAFQNHHRASAHQHDIPYIHFDYHSEIKGTNLKNLDKLRSRLVKYFKDHDFFYTSSITSGEAQRQQTGTIRTNCLDCLDRTNAVQTMIGMEILPKQLECLGLVGKAQLVSRFEEVYKQIWQHNGDHISRIYAGTGALGGGRSKYQDATRSATRAIQNNFLDSSKQEAIDVLLTGSSLYGDLADKARALLSSRYLHASPNILRRMVERASEYTQPQSLRVCVATYNVNGSKHYRSILCRNVSLADWLLDAHKTHPDSMLVGYDYDKPVDIFAVGFEEIVDLNASNIMKASTTNAMEWHKEVLKTVSREHKYVVLTHIQLVGVVLFILIRPHLAPFIRDVAVDKVKTGLGGATGNKGGVAIRFLVHSSSFCFVCAHLAAGQSQVNDRNEDYAEITRRMTFPMGRTILSHDYVFWCGDFNYRIDLHSEEVKRLVETNSWIDLQEFDQLNTQRAIHKAFQGFEEGLTNFPPTYKYDVFSDDWDSSEKARTPAWTDRILWRYRPLPGCPDNRVTQLLYTRAELRMSDHRPVVGLFEVETLEVDEERRGKLMEEVVGQQGPPDGTVIISMATSQDFDDDVVDEIVERFTEIGEVIIVRFVGSDMWVLYKSGQDALEAISLNQTQIGGHTLNVRLKTPEWQAEIEQELRLCAANTGALFNPFTNSLLGDDFSVPSMEFDMDDQEEEEEDGAPSAPLEPPRQHSAVQRAPSPGLADGSRPAERPPFQPPRPETPPARPAPVNAAPRGSSEPSPLVFAETAAPLRASPSPEPQRKTPPQRPNAPPAKPPPPQRPAGGPPKPSPPSSRPATPGSAAVQKSGSMPKVRQPLRPPPAYNANARTKKASAAKIGNIGLPMNVKHTSHAETPDEAEKLIDLLMRADTIGATGAESLPPPLKPSASASNLKLGVEEDSNLLVPKPMPRSRTTQDMDTEDRGAKDGGADFPPAPARRPPAPTPRTRSSELISAPPPEQPPPSVPSDRSSASVPAPQPRSRPKKESEVSSVGGISVFHQLPEKDAWEEREREEGQKVSPPVLPSVRPNQGQVTASEPSLLDAPNSPAVSVSDPFDTSHVRDPFTIHPTPRVESFQSGASAPDTAQNSAESRSRDPFKSSTVPCPDPFDTSSVVGKMNRASDPFDTSSVVKQGVVMGDTDPFDTSAALSQAGVRGKMADPFDTSNVRGALATVSVVDTGEAWDMQGHSPPSTQPPSLSCPSHPPPPLSTAPPPPPRRDLSSSIMSDPSSFPLPPTGPPPSFLPPIPSRPPTGEGKVNGPPPVPIRPPGGAPAPPVPRRPSPANQNEA